VRSAKNYGRLNFASTLLQLFKGKVVRLCSHDMQQNTFVAPVCKENTAKPVVEHHYQRHPADSERRLGEQIDGEPVRVSSQEAHSGMLRSKLRSFCPLATILACAHPKKLPFKADGRDVQRLDRLLQVR
jgi:hypothetical protein